MSDVSGASKFRAVSRVVGRQTGSNRWIRATFRAGDTVLKSFRRTLSVLWHEVTGFFFLCFAIIGGFAAVREYRFSTQGQPTQGRALVAGIFALMFAYFAFSSFARAGRKT